MKKNNYIMVMFIIALAAILGGCASAPAASGVDELDRAIRDTSDYLNASIPAGSTIVILNIQSDSIDLSDYIIDELIANVVNDRIFTVVDRQRLDEIRAEQNFQYSGEVDDNLAQEIGRFLGAQTIVSGAIGRLGAGYRLRVRALNVQTAQVQGQFNRNMSASPLVADLLGSSGGAAVAASTSGTSTAGNRITITNNTGENITAIGIYPTADSDINILLRPSDSPIPNGASRTFDVPRTVNTSVRQIIHLMSSSSTSYAKLNILITTGVTITFTQSDRVAESQPAPAQTAPAPAQTAQAPAQTTPAPTQTTPAVRSYRVGDTGPAGGIIFYDKGNNSQGWRYLEAAPYETEVQIRWSVNHTNIENTLETIGSGRRNTQIIVDSFSRTSGEWDNAAQYCDDLLFGGFDDWFLPSKAELDQMYGNLKRRNLGDFRDNWYWSSTQSSFWQTNTQNFSNGSMSNATPKNERSYVRPIRQVAGPN